MASENQVKSEILLETGTNELEIMEFTISGNIFGINVAKITEIMQCKSIKPMPNSHHSVEGVFMPRDKIITVINLADYMGLPNREDRDRDIFMITSFNQITIAFHVDTVEAIHRIKWSDIEKPDSTIYGGTEGLATGIARVGAKLITIVDFEKIIFDINAESGLHISEITEMGERDRSEKPVIIAEDSTLLMKMLMDSLHAAGYTNVKAFQNGQEAWDYLTGVRDEAVSLSEPIASKAAAVITDIEMPQMDGHRLTKLIKDEQILHDVPVIIFSSLINEAMRVKGESVGADAQLSKPEIGNLITTLDHWIL